LLGLRHAVSTNAVEPKAYLSATMTAIVNGHKRGTLQSSRDFARFDR
jgi:hypothetical protein